MHCPRSREPGLSQWEDALTHWTLGDVVVTLTCDLWTHVTYYIDDHSRNSSQKNGVPVMTSRYWFNWWFGNVRQRTNLPGSMNQLWLSPHDVTRPPWVKYVPSGWPRPCSPELRQSINNGPWTYFVWYKPHQHRWWFYFRVGFLVRNLITAMTEQQVVLCLGTAVQNSSCLMHYNCFTLVFRVFISQMKKGFHLMIAVCCSQL